MSRALCFGCRTFWRISLVAEELSVTQDGLCSTHLVTTTTAITTAAATTTTAAATTTTTATTTAAATTTTTTTTTTGDRGSTVVEVLC